MLSIRFLLACGVFCLFAGMSLGAQPVARNPQLAERVVAYDIEARLDAQKKTIDGTERLTYRNLTGRPLDRFPFHLYLNGFQPKATFMREGREGQSVRFRALDERGGSIRVTRFVVDGVGDLTGAMRFIQPDDGNPDDHTVFEVRLPKPVAPGASVRFNIAFHAKLPEVIARTGYSGDFFMVAQWFPKVGVWWHGGWNCHQFHAHTEFFADFGTYDVRATVPQNYVVGATGDELSSVKRPDGTKTVTWHADDVHDFAWTASPSYRVVEDEWTGSAGIVRIRALMSPGHLSSASRYMHAAKFTLDRFDRWYGPYPYHRLTIVDPPQGGGKAGGMEYPTLITAGTSRWDSRFVHEAEVVVEHEFGHQYFYGMIATNEFEEAWLDEGINSYAEVKVLDAMFPGGRAILDIPGWTLFHGSFQRLGYLLRPDTDPLERFAWKYFDGTAYGAVTYMKTATVLLTLEGLIGEDTMRRVIRTWYERYRFKHPAAEDFIKTVQEVSGRDLRWYFDQAVYGTEVLDYAVDRAACAPADPTLKPKDEKPKSTVYRSTVVLRRKGDFLFPVDLRVKFDNGEVVNERWDGRDRWQRYSYDRKAKLVSAELDPEHRVWLDRDMLNNSKRLEPEMGANVKVAVYWTFLTQVLAQLFTWVV